MKKLTVLFVAVISVFTLCLCSCSGGSNKNPAPADVAAAVKENAQFTELIALTDDNISRRYYGIDLEMIEEYQAEVCSSGAMADEIAIFKVKDKENVEDMLEVVRERKQELYDSFVDYVPDEINKIENALIGSNGNYVYLVVCSDRAAAKAAVESCF